MTREQVLDLLKLMLDQFESDPPDTEFQEGYRSALLEVSRCVLSADDGSEPQRKTPDFTARSP